MKPDGRLIYRPVLAIDVEKYSARNAWQQFVVQRDLRAVIDSAAKAAMVNLEDSYQQPGGDGELVVLPDDVDMPRLVEVFPRRLGQRLRELNDGWPLQERLRVRLAIHYGTLSWGPFGPAGDAPIEADRLLNAKSVKQFLALRQDLDVALVVSNSVYRDVVLTGFCALDLGKFRPIRVRSKGIWYRGHIYCPHPTNGTEQIAE
jgi:class 3 adenylate cyclase